MPVSTRKSTRTPATNHRQSGYNVYHLTTILLVLFAITHTIGGLFGSNDFGVTGNAVFANMKSVKFDFFGSQRTFHNFYLGFGLMVTVFYLLSAALSWELSKFPNHEVLRPIKWMLFLAHVLNMLLCYMYFFIAPMLVSTIITALLGYECYKL